MSSSSTSMRRSAAPSDNDNDNEIGPDNDLFWLVVTAFEEWCDEIGGTKLTIDSPAEQLASMAAHFEQWVRKQIPQLAHQVVADPNVYYGAMVAFLDRQEYEDDDDDDDE
jgi:hypothetical protein